jgi:hypothetical protein
MLNTSEPPNPYQGLTKPQALATMRQLVAEETLNHYRMGQLCNYVQDSKMLDGKKYASPVDFFSEEIPEMSRAALFMYGAVARAFSEVACSRFGMTRLSLLLTYKKMTRAELSYSDPGGTFIGVPDKKGVVKHKIFADCTVRELRQALAHLREADPSTPFPAEQVALVDRYRAAVTGRFPQGTAIRVQLRDHEGEVVVDFKGIPVMKVDLLTEALLDQLYLAPKLPEVEQVPLAS